MRIYSGVVRIDVIIVSSIRLFLNRKQKGLVKIQFKKLKKGCEMKLKSVNQGIKLWKILLFYGKSI